MNWSIFIRSLDHGGAQRQALVLAKALHEKGERVRVVTLYGGGALEDTLKDSGVTLVCLQKRGRWDVFGFSARLLRELHGQQPQVLYSFLTVPNVIGALLKPLLRRTTVVWGVRASNMDLAHYDRFARVTDRLERSLASLADLVIVNSKAGLEYALSRGFPSKRTIEIANGIDSLLFSPNLDGRRRVRQEWRIKDDDVLIGLAARFDPMKDHRTFIEAAALVAANCPRALFVCVGTGSAAIAQQAKALAREKGIGERIIWAGSREDMRDVYNAFDIACSSSRFGEGFSNAVAEAMSCGTPCVATRVGDSAEIIGKSQFLSSPGNADELAESILRLARLTPEERFALGRTARERIEARYGPERLAERTISAVRSNAGSLAEKQ